MNYDTFLARVIDDGIAAAQHDYAKSPLKLDGAVEGFNLCRNIDPVGLKALLAETHVMVDAKRLEEASDYWYWRCLEAEVEWVCNVVSALLATMGQSVIIAPTARGMMQAHKILNQPQHGRPM